MKNKSEIVWRTITANKLGSYLLLPKNPPAQLWDCTCKTTVGRVSLVTWSGGLYSRFCLLFRHMWRLTEMSLARAGEGVEESSGLQLLSKVSASYNRVDSSSSSNNCNEMRKSHWSVNWKKFNNPPISITDSVTVTYTRWNLNRLLVRALHSIYVIF